MLQQTGASVAKLLNLAEGILKIALLDEVTLPVMRKQWSEPKNPRLPLSEENRRCSSNAEGNGPNVAESLEIQLALRHRLGDTLNLPFKVNNPLYAQGMAQLNESDTHFVLDYVNQTMTISRKKSTDSYPFRAGQTI